MEIGDATQTNAPGTCPHDYEGLSRCVFTITITTTNLKTKKQVCKWDIEWNMGSVSGKKY